MTLREQERRARQRQASLNEPQPYSRYARRIMSFRAWCELNGFSIPTGRRIIGSGDGPKVTQLGLRRIGIREDHNAEWQDSRIIGEQS
jgi:predicted DNA-binding transcriptional regulator AlpA